MKFFLMTAALLYTTSLPAAAQEEIAPTTDSLVIVFVNSIKHNDATAFAQCWISATSFMELMDSHAESNPEIAEQLPSLEEALDYYRTRNRKIRVLYENLEAAIRQHGLSTDEVSVEFGDIRRKQEGGIVAYEVPQAFVLESDAGWSIAFEIDDIMSFGGHFQFFDSPLHAILTLPDGEMIDLLANEED